ncbi:MAG: alkaline phosphatase PafA [Chitinophagales bacterium]
MKISLRTCLVLVSLLHCVSLFSQTKQTPALPDRPKLVVGIVVDQMRWDFLYRYSDKYGNGGFKRLLNEGYSCENTHINYSPSFTACGHTCVYTGSVPSVHGITGNSWFQYNENRTVYCTEDTMMKTVGSASNAGRMSPNRLLPTTITDELRLATNFRAKTIGIALKDRSSILPAGHAANAAYFYDPSSGNWITSSYYMNELPVWVQQFNASKWPEKFMADNWSTLLNADQYLQSTEDDEPWEGNFENEQKPVFAHKVSEIKPSFKALAATPFGSTVTLKMAEGAVLNEQMGSDAITDFLAVSLSSPDYIGHRFGPNSREAEDCYLRLDKDLSDFFTFLDNNVGKGNYVLFLTADHGAAHSAGFLQEHKIPAGVFDADTAVKQLNAKLQQRFGAGEWIVAYDNMQLYFDHKLMEEKNVNADVFKTIVKDFLLQFQGISKVLDLHNLANENVDANMRQAISNGVFMGRSGDMFILHQPGWFEDFTKGTTHGTVYPYDTHIPLVWMGWKVKHGEDHSEIHMTDIAPTIAGMLHIQEPSGNIGRPIQGLFK